MNLHWGCHEIDFLPNLDSEHISCLVAETKCKIFWTSWLSNLDFKSILAHVKVFGISVRFSKQKVDNTTEALLCDGGRWNHAKVWSWLTSPDIKLDTALTSTWMAMGHWLTHLLAHKKENLVDYCSIFITRYKNYFNLKGHGPLTPLPEATNKKSDSDWLTHPYHVHTKSDRAIYVVGWKGKENS